MQCSPGSAPQGVPVWKGCNCKEMPTVNLQNWLEVTYTLEQNKGNQY